MKGFDSRNMSARYNADRLETPATALELVGEGSTIVMDFQSTRCTSQCAHGNWFPYAGKEERMTYYTQYETGLIGTLTLASDGEAIVGCWFDNDRYFGVGVADPLERKDDLAVFEQARAWLDRYFAGGAPDPRELPLAARATEFQLRVREAMLDIPYGQTTTYGAIADRIAAETGRRQSARAVGGAVGHNPLCLIVPCHRVVGANGNLTGFGGGIDMKITLLEHERAMQDTFRRPKKGTALVGTPHADRSFLSAQDSATR